MDLLLDVMNGIRTWDVEDDSKEWWLMNPESEFLLATAVGTCMCACVCTCGYTFHSTYPKHIHLKVADMKLCVGITN